MISGIWQRRNRGRPKIGTAWWVRAGVDWIGGGGEPWMRGWQARAGRAHRRPDAPPPSQWTALSHCVGALTSAKSNPADVTRALSFHTRRRQHPARGRLDRPAAVQGHVTLANTPYTRVCSPLYVCSSLKPASALSRIHLSFCGQKSRCHCAGRLTRAKISLLVCVFDKDVTLRQHSYAHSVISELGSFGKGVWH